MRSQYRTHPWDVRAESPQALGPTQVSERMRHMSKKKGPNNPQGPTREEGPNRLPSRHGDPRYVVEGTCESYFPSIDSKLLRSFPVVKREDPQ